MERIRPNYAKTVTTDWQLLTVYFTATAQGTARVHLAKYDTTGALLWDDVELVNGATATSGLKMRYYPYGQEVGTATPNDVAKFGTYTRDSGSGLDYAMNRYYQSTWGRFTTADPYRASGGPADPGSWNRYSYTRSDPINRHDPLGLQDDVPTFEITGYCYGCMGYSGGGGGAGELPIYAELGVGDIFTSEPNPVTGAGIWKAYEAARLIADRWTYSQECENLLSKIKVGTSDIQAAARRVDIIDGTTSEELYFSLVHNKNKGDGVAGQHLYPGTVAMQFRKQPGAGAMADLNGNRVFIRPHYFSFLELGSAVLTMFHELLHNTSSLFDHEIQEAWGLPITNDTRNIDWKIWSECWN